MGADVPLRSIVRACAATMLLMLTWVATADAAKVFVIDSYHANYPWTQECRRGLEDGFASKHDITYFEMDTKRLGPAAFQAQAHKAWDALKGSKPDIVITMDDNALKFLGPRISRENIPLVFMGINQNPRAYFDDNNLPSNVTGVLERPLLRRSVAMLAGLLNTLEARVLLMMDNGMTSQAIIQNSLFGKSSFAVGIFEVESYLTGSYAQWQSKVRNLASDGYDAVIMANYGTLRDEQGRQIPLDQTSKWTSENSPVPVFAFWNYSMGRGKAIGGLIISGYDQGRSAARMADTMLAGGPTPPVSVPNQGEYRYSRSELDRWRLKVPVNIAEDAMFVD